MKTRVVHFYSEGSKLEGDYFLPDDLRSGERRPAIVLCHGYSSIRKAILPDYAKLPATRSILPSGSRNPRSSRSNGTTST